MRLTALLLLFQLNIIYAQSSSDVSLNDNVLDYNKCFSIENGYDSLIYSDTVLFISDKGNLFKKISISDSLFIWKCGRNKIEYLIDTFNCGYPVEKMIDWETDKFIVLTTVCGSYCWTNKVISLSEIKPIQYLSYSAIDLETYNVLIISDDDLIVRNLITEMEFSIPIDEDSCLDMYPLFAIKDIRIKGNKIYYSIKCKDGVYREKEKSFNL